MKRASTATRLSISLVSLTLSVLLAAQSLGLMPDPTTAALKGRRDLCESIAIGCSVAAQQGDVDAVRQAVTAFMSRNHDVESIGLRTSDGALLVATPGHQDHWTLKEGDRSTANLVQVPIFQGEKRWGSLELCLRPLERSGFAGFMANPLLRLMLFTATIAFAAYLLYLRKTLRYLDPSAVIPERVKAMLDTLAEGVLVLDKRERVVLANDAFAAMISRPAAELQGLAASTFPWLDTQDGKPPAVLPWVQTLQGGAPRKGFALDLRDTRALSGGAGAGAANSDEAEVSTRRRLAVNASPIQSDKGSPRGVLLTFDDVTEIETANAQLRETLGMLGKSRDEVERQNKELQAAATTDPLTGCRNRRSFHAEFQNCWSGAQRYGHSLACVMVDVDFFKKVNDRYGHSTGDQVLQHVSAILRSLARESDVVCRYGGEEFCILLPQADIISATQAAERYRASIESQSCGGLTVTASIGVSALELGAQAPQELLDQADKALYAAKRSGRNRVVRWDEIRNTTAAEEQSGSQVSPVPEKVSVPIAFHAVTALMSALSHRDKGTADHSRRVADLCTAAAAGLMSVKDRFVLEVGALLHDIGKLGVPDAVLLKPGALTEQEWKIMRSHDRMGVEIISAAFASSELTEIVRTHHAQFDGNASDLSLPSGRDIPLGARILALADAYDAMVSDRPYRGAQDREAGFNELRRCAGAQFDPELVEPFIAAVIARDRATENSSTDRTSSKAEHRAPTSSNAAFPTTGSEGGTEADHHVISEEAALRLRLEMERLACAAETGDMAALAETAREVATMADIDGLHSVSERLLALERSATSSVAAADPAGIARQVNELIALCRSSSATQRIDPQAAEVEVPRHSNATSPSSPRQ